MSEAEKQNNPTGRAQERARRVRELFDKIVELPAAQRQANLDSACGADSQLRREVQSLISAHDTAGLFLGDPTIAVADLGGFETFSPGVKIGRYALIEKIGEGGYGAVFLAQQESPLRRRVALKVIKPGMDTRQVVARFELERESLAIMNHSGIARVLDAGSTDGGRPYFVMELVEGRPITDFCRDFELDLPARLRLFQSVCMAVQHAHGKGIIHRDLKPGNVLVAMLDGNPVAKVIDFGIAKALVSEDGIDPRMTVEGPSYLMGTPQYISPEQAAGRANEIDGRTDVYSLGALLYEILTDAAPFDADSMHRLSMTEIQQMIQHQDPVAPSARLAWQSGQGARSCGITPSRLRGDLDRIVIRAMDKSPDRRYSTPESLADDIERYLTDQPITARSPSLIYRAAKFIRRRRTELALTAASAVAIIAVATATAIIMTLRDHRPAIVSISPLPIPPMPKSSPATEPVAIGTAIALMPPTTLPATKPAPVVTFVPVIAPTTRPITQVAMAPATEPGAPVGEPIVTDDQPDAPDNKPDPSDDKPNAPAQPAGPMSPGLVASIFSTGQFMNLHDTRIDPQIDFDWPPHVPPDPGMGTPRYSIRWTGVLLVPQTGILGIGFNAASGGRVYFNGKEIIGFLTKGNVRNRRSRTAGAHDLMVEYWNRSGGGHARLYWILSDDQEQTIPPEALWHYQSQSP